MNEQEAIERLREDVRRNPEGGTVYMDIDDLRALLDREKRLTEALEEERVKELLGEGIHTAFRKATDCEQAHPIWKLIAEMPPNEWGKVVDLSVGGVP